MDDRIQQLLKQMTALEDELRTALSEQQVGCAKWVYLPTIAMVGKVNRFAHPTKLVN